MMLYIVRHGETEWNTLKKIQGQEADIPLNDAGHKQAEKTGLYLMKYRLGSGRFDCMMSSPLLRAKESAEIIKELVGFQGEIDYDDNLKEKKHGKLSGLTDKDDLMIKRKELKELLLLISDPIEKYNSFNFVDSMVNNKFDIGIESTEELETRIRPFIQKLIDSPCKKIIVVSHWGLLIELLGIMFHLTKVPKGNFDNGSNCWISYITYDIVNGFQLISYPNTEHLDLV